MIRKGCEMRQLGFLLGSARGRFGGKGSSNRISRRARKTWVG